jgi:hypothetical protein
VGWWSPAYGRLEPTTTIRVTCKDTAPFWIVSVFDLNPLDPVTGVELMPVWTEAGSMAHGTAARISRGGSNDYVLFAEPKEGHDGTSWRVGELETDARMLLARVTRGSRVIALALADGSFVRQTRRGGLSLALGRNVPALYIDQLTLRNSSTCAASQGL